MGMTFLKMALIAWIVLAHSAAVADEGKQGPEQSEVPACAVVDPKIADLRTPRDLLYLERCLRRDSSSARRRKLSVLRVALRAQGYAPIALALSPDTATAEMTASFPEDILRNDDELWLEQGEYRISVRSRGYQSATFSIAVQAGVQMVVPLTLEKVKLPKDTVIDIGQEPGSSLGDVSHSADMRNKEFDTLIADKYRRAPDPQIAAPVKREAASLVWPTVTALASLGVLGSGLVLQNQDRLDLALASYGVASILGGGAIYLYFRSPPGTKNNSQTDKIPVIDGALLGYQYAW